MVPTCQETPDECEGHGDEGGEELVERLLPGRYGLHLHAVILVVRQGGVDDAQALLSVEGLVGPRGHDDADDGADDGGHPVQVVNAARVVDEEAVLEPRLESREGGVLKVIALLHLLIQNSTRLSSLTGQQQDIAMPKTLSSTYSVLINLGRARWCEQIGSK